MWLDLEVIDLMIDTAGSWEGRFPEPDKGDYLVTIDTPEGGRRVVLVSRRYTAATDAEDAVALAVGAVCERDSLDEGDVRPAEVRPIAGVEHHGYRWGSDYGTSGCVEVVRSAGRWYTRPCFPGCLPDGEWSDMETSERAAVLSAFEGDL